MGNLYKIDGNSGARKSVVNNTTIVEISSSSDFPTTVDANTTYVIRGTVEAPSVLVINQEGVSFVGEDRAKDIIVSNNPGPLFTIVDHTFELSNLGLRNSLGPTGATQGSIIDATNITLGATANSFGRLKYLTIQNCEFRNCYDIGDITGFDLVDFEQNLFWYITGDKGLLTQSVHHLEYGSNEFLKWQDESTGLQPESTMLRIGPNVGTTGPAGASGIPTGTLNMVGNIIHPRSKQIGLKVDDLSSTNFSTLSANTFNSTGLTKDTLSTVTDALLSRITTDPGGNADATYGNIVSSNNGIGTGLRFNVTISGGLVSSLTVDTTTSSPTEFRGGDIITIAGNDIGGTTGVTDVEITLTKSDILGILFSIRYDLQTNYIVSGNAGARDFGVIPNVQIIEEVDDLPDPVNGVITLTDNIQYRIAGNVDIGSFKIQMGSGNSIFGNSSQNDIITYTGATGATMFTSVNNDVIIQDIGIECQYGVLLDATNINYAINPAGGATTDPFQGRNKRIQLLNCNLNGGGNAALTTSGGNLGSIEGFGTVNMNGNLIRFWDDGFDISNCLSWEAVGNKVVLWNQVNGVMFTLRANNWSGQTDTVGSYIPTGFNALLFDANILHPKNTETGFEVTPLATVALGTVSANVFFGGPAEGSLIFSGGFYEFFPGIIIEGNQGLANNTPEFQVNLLTNATDEGTTTGSTSGDLTVLEGNGQFILRRFSRFFSIRGVCTAGSSAAAFIDNEKIYVGATSTGSTAVGYFQSFSPTGPLGPELYLYQLVDESGGTGPSAVDTFIPAGAIFTGVSSGATAQITATQVDVNPGALIKYYAKRLTGVTNVINFTSITNNANRNTFVGLQVDDIADEFAFWSLFNDTGSQPFVGSFSAIEEDIPIDTKFTITQGFNNNVGRFERIIWTGKS